MTEQEQKALYKWVKDVKDDADELERYREIGTLGEFKALKENWLNKFDSLIEYRIIGTVEECREAVEKLKTAKEAIRKLLCNEYGSVCQFCEQDNNTDAMCRKVGGSGSWCCENAKWNGRTEWEDE